MTSADEVRWWGGGGYSEWGLISSLSASELQRRRRSKAGRKGHWERTPSNWQGWESAPLLRVRRCRDGSESRGFKMSRAVALLWIPLRRMAVLGGWKGTVRSRSVILGGMSACSHASISASSTPLPALNLSHKSYYMFLLPSPAHLPAIHNVRSTQPLASFLPPTHTFKLSLR